MLKTGQKEQERGINNNNNKKKRKTERKAAGVKATVGGRSRDHVPSSPVDGGTNEITSRRNCLSEDLVSQPVATAAAASNRLSFIVYFDLPPHPLFTTLFLPPSFYHPLFQLNR